MSHFARDVHGREQSVRLGQLLNPIRATATIIPTLGVIWLLAGGYTAIAATLGRGMVCASLPVDTGPPRTVAKGFAHALGLVPHTQGLLVGGIEACADHPDPLLRLAGVLSALPLIILFLGAVVLAYKLARLAGGVNGLHSNQSADTMRFLGWYLIVGSAVVAVVESAANAVIVQKLARNVGWAPSELHFPVIPLVAGLLLIAFSRMTREASDSFPASIEISGGR
jgi:hypothetical protein